jgi:hypothetical protein
MQSPVATTSAALSSLVGFLRLPVGSQNANRAWRFVIADHTVERHHLAISYHVSGLHCSAGRGRLQAHGLPPKLRFDISRREGTEKRSLQDVPRRSEARDLTVSVSLECKGPRSRSRTSAALESKQDPGCRLHPVYCTVLCMYVQSLTV